MNPVKLRKNGTPYGFGPLTVALLRQATRPIDIDSLPRGAKRRLIFLRNLGIVRLHRPFIGSGCKYALTKDGTEFLKKHFSL